MNPFVRLETICANAVERAFATAFPSAIEPVQIARKLVAAFEGGGALAGRSGRRFVVGLNAADFARFEASLPYLQRQWTDMLVRLSERSGRPERPPDVRAQIDAAVATGTVTIAVEALPAPARLALVVRRGVPAGGRLTFTGRATIGRDPSCDLVLVDPRVSRRHLDVFFENATPSFRDLGSSNGTRLNGSPTSSAELGLGDVLAVGDSELAVVDADGE